MTLKQANLEQKLMNYIKKHKYNINKTKTCFLKRVKQVGKPIERSTKKEEQNFNKLDQK